MRLLFFLVFSLTSFANAQETLTPKDEIQNFLTGLANSMNARDVDQVLSAWNEDGEMITLAGGIYKGKQDLKTLFAESFSNPYKNAKYELLVQFVRFKGSDAAVVDGIWKTKNAGPADYPSCGIFLYNLSKKAGKWKIDLSYSSVPRQGHTAEHGRNLSWVKVCKESTTP